MYNKNLSNIKLSEEPEDFYLHNMIDSNEIDAPDGEYYVAIYGLDYLTCDEYCEKLEIKSKKFNQDFQNLYRWFISDTQVEVRTGWFHLQSLLQATKEILLKQKYWGRYLESIEFIKPTEYQKGYLTIFVGS